MISCTKCDTTYEPSSGTYGNKCPHCGEFPMTELPIVRPPWETPPKPEPMAMFRTLRDGFAEAALTGLLAGTLRNEVETESSQDLCRDYAVFCYDMADAMMKARGK